MVNSNQTLDKDKLEEKSLFFSHLKELSKSSGKSLNQIERDLGFPRNALSNYKGKADPSATRLIALSYYFHVSPEYLMGWEISSNTSMEQFFNSLTSLQKKELYDLSQNWLLKKII